MGGINERGEVMPLSAAFGLCDREKDYKVASVYLNNDSKPQKARNNKNVSNS